MDHHDRDSEHANQHQARGPAQGPAATSEPEGLLRLLAAATFLIFFQAFMIPPIRPALARAFSSSISTLALAVPAYLVLYGVATLVWGPLSDRIGRARVILSSMTAFVALTAATAAAGSGGWFLTARIVTALGASGVVPIGMALLGDLFPYARRGHALGWLFGAMAGGTAVGSTAGALTEPLIGWQGLFLAVAATGAAVLALLWARRSQLAAGHGGAPRPWRAVAAGYLHLLRDRRAARTYTYVLINAVVHSGIYTWLGVYFHQRYGLGEIGIGLALLGYGIPGFAFGPLIGRLADHYGRALLIPAGLATTGIAALTLAVHLPILVPALALTVLSLGFDSTQPLLAGIVTTVSTNRGQAMGLNAFTLFVGFGLGSLIFQAVMAQGFPAALTGYGLAALIAAATAIPTFAAETVSLT